MNENNILTRIAEAREGSRELSDAIAKAGFPEMFERAVPAPYQPIGFYYDKYNDLFQIEDHSESLDAALPGENIEAIYWEGNLCTALHVDHEKQQQFTAIAHTEALARRGAALKAMMDG